MRTTCGFTGNGKLNQVPRDAELFYNIIYNCSYLGNLYTKFLCDLARATFLLPDTNS